ncbi:hypothetical protein M569_03513, partial [Genlisea aurea]
AAALSFAISIAISRPKFPDTKIRCVGWDPEGILGAPRTGHIARLEFKKRLQKDSKAREDFERRIREENALRKARRESRVIPEGKEKLVEYLLDTEAQEIDFEIARLRPLLNDEFFSYLKHELGKLRFAVSKTQSTEDRVMELEALGKALEEGIEAYDKMQYELVRSRKSLMKLLTADDVKTTLLEMVEENEVNRSLLALLDENIASAYQGNQTQVARHMENIRGAMLKYITL